MKIKGVFQMKTQTSWVKLAALYVGIGVIISVIMVLFFQYNDFFRSLFYDRVTPGGAVAELSPEQAAENTTVSPRRTVQEPFAR